MGGTVIVDGRCAGRGGARACALALALCLAAPASAHLLARGTPLSELAASSPVAVIGRVEAVAAEAGARRASLLVEQALRGEVAPGAIQLSLDGHHPPDYQPGDRVLVFLTGGAPPWHSRQTSLDRVDVPGDEAEREALVAATRAYATLADVPGRRARIEQGLAPLSLAHLASASPRVRREALLDLMALAPARALDEGDVQRLVAVALRRETPATLAPGLVPVLDAVRGSDPIPALLAVLEGSPSPRARALAAQAVGRRRAAAAAPALGRALADPALEVRLTARRALDRIAPSAAIARDISSSTPREGNHDAEALHVEPR